MAQESVEQAVKACTAQQEGKRVIPAAKWPPIESAARDVRCEEDALAGVSFAEYERTYRKLHGTYRIREIDRVIVKGKTEPVAIYEVLDYHSEDSFPNLMETVSYFKDGLGHYRRGNWQQAITAFSETLKLHPADRLAQHYIERCEHMSVNPPADDWNGVWVMKTK